MNPTRILRSRRVFRNHVFLLIYLAGSFEIFSRYLKSNMRKVLTIFAIVVLFANDNEILMMTMKRKSNYDNLKDSEVKKVPF